MGRNLQKIGKKHKAFVDHYLECYDAGEAAKRAGFKGKWLNSTGAQLRRDPLIKAEIERRWKELMYQRGIEKQYLIDKLLMVIEEAEKRDDKGNMKLQTILKALDQMAKLGGFYSETNQFNIQQNNNEIKIEIVRPEDRSVDGRPEDKTIDIDHKEINEDEES
jgi:phage terminase small subunit